MFRTLSASIIRITKNCISSHWWVSWVGVIYILWGGPRSVVTALCHSLFRKASETCIVLLQWLINILLKLHLVGSLYNIVLWCTETQTQNYTKCVVCTL
jgi:hypothetical protein